MRKRWFYLHANACFKSFYLFIRLFPVGRHFKNISFTCMRAQFSKTRSTFLRFFEIFGYAKKHVFTCLSFSCFHIIFSVFSEALGLLLASFWSLCRLFGFLVSSFRYLWRAWAVCGHSLLLFVVPLARLGCLWARGPLRDCFLLHFRLILV